MRMLFATVSLIAMAGVAFAGEPQKQITQPVVASAQKQAPAQMPQRMTDQQLDKVVAGAVDPEFGRSTALSAGGLTFPSGVPSGIETALNAGGFGQNATASSPGGGVCTTNRNGGCPF